MSRSVQIVGHTNYTSGFLKACKRTDDIVGNITDFDESSLMTLWVYIDANNNRWEEFIQYQPWSSGPMYFLAIKNNKTGEVIGWTKDESLCGTYHEFDRNLGIFWV